MPIPEGFTRSQLGLPEDDNRRTLDRPTTGLWHVLTDKGPATVFVSTVNGSTSVYLGSYFLDTPFQLSSRFGRVAITEAPDGAIDALTRAGYEFTDRRIPR